MLFFSVFQYLFFATCRLGVDGGVGVSPWVGQARRPAPPEEAAQDAAFQRLQQRALPGPGVSEQLEFDPGLDGLGGAQLLDVAQFVVVLVTRRKNLMFVCCLKSMEHERILMPL